MKTTADRQKTTDSIHKMLQRLNPDYSVIEANKHLEQLSDERVGKIHEQIKEMYDREG